MIQRLLFLLVCGLMLVSVAQAQAIQPPPGETPNPDANVSFPPPVFVLEGQVAILGTAAPADMVNYFLEFRSLTTRGATEQRFWLPAALPQSAPVRDGVLGTWDTSRLADGLYELRLTVNRGTSSPLVVTVSPLRIANRSFLPPTPTATPFVQPTATPIFIPPTATPVIVRPQVTATVDANVRRGDSVAYERVGYLLEGDSARVIGISNRSGWYRIRLDDGTVGFISPNIVNFAGERSVLPQVQPPPPPATPTPTPTVTPTAQPNLIVLSTRLEPTQPRCGETFTLYVRLRNDGNARTNSSGELRVTDTHIASGTVTEMTFGGYPRLNVGQTFEAIIPITVSTFFEETHRLTITLDQRDDIPESNENDNIVTTDYVLQQAGCG